MKTLLQHIEEVAIASGQYHLITNDRTVLTLISEGMDHYMAEVLNTAFKAARVHGEDILITIHTGEENNETHKTDA